MPRLTEPQRRGRREEIAAAALRCFASKGFAETSMADIIAEAHSSAGSVYSHFSSKTELLRFAVTTVLEEQVGAMQDSLSHEAGPLTPHTVLRTLLGELTITRDEARLLVQVWGQVPVDPELADFAAETIGRLREIVRAALAGWAAENDDAATHAADAVIATVHGFVLRCVLDRDLDVEVLRGSILAGVGRWR